MIDDKDQVITTPAFGEGRPQPSNPRKPELTPEEKKARVKARMARRKAWIEAWLAKRKDGSASRFNEDAMKKALEKMQEKRAARERAVREGKAKG